MTNANLAVCGGQVLEYRYIDGVTPMLQAQTYKYHHRLRISGSLFTTILYTALFANLRVFTVGLLPFALHNNGARRHKTGVLF